MLVSRSNDAHGEPSGGAAVGVRSGNGAISPEQRRSVRTVVLSTPPLLGGARHQRRRAGRSDPIIVEIIGPPGAGKSSMISRLERRLERRGVDVHAHRAIGFFDPDGRRESAGRRRVTQIAAVALNARLLLWLWWHGRDVWGPKELAAMCVRVHFAKRLRRRNGLHLLDEGPLRAAPGLMPDAERRGRLLRLLPRPDLVVALTVDPEVAIGRVRHRGVGAITSPRSHELLRAGHGQHLAVIDVVARMIPTVRCDTTGAEDHAELIGDWILEQLGARAGHDAPGGQP